LALDFEILNIAFNMVDQVKKNNFSILKFGFREFLESLNLNVACQIQKDNLQ